jgi:hypothetical protein
VRRFLTLAVFSFVAIFALNYFLAISAISFSPSVALAGPIQADIPMFATEGGAQAHCPRDIVVWLNSSSGIYRLKGERSYGRTKHGAFVCEKEADASGYQETENGQ